MNRRQRLAEPKDGRHMGNGRPIQVQSTRRWIKFLSPFLPFSVSVRVLQPCRLAEVDQLEPGGRKVEARMMDDDHIHEFHTVQGMQIEHMTLVPNGCVLYCK